MPVRIKLLLPILVLTIGTFATILLVWARPEVETRENPVLPPVVRVVIAKPQDQQLLVASQGTVLPRTETDLAAEVSGRIVKVAPAFASGGFFDPGEVLVELDARDYRLAQVRAQAQVEQARLRLVRERAEAELAVEEWQRLGEGKASPLVLREPQLAEAEANLSAARAELERSALDLERTQVRAPFAGRVRHKHADLGQFVNRGTPLARVYAVDYAEVRLPVADAELAFLDLPLSYRGEEETGTGPEVALAAEFAGRTHLWRGRIVRTEGEIDPHSRMVHLIARVENPYERGSDLDRPPLSVGLFVHAQVAGRTARSVLDLPRAAMRGESQVLVVDGEDRLRYRSVDLLRATARRVLVQGGLSTGERICISPLDAVVDGMRVRPVIEEVGGKLELTSSPRL